MNPFVARRLVSLVVLAILLGSAGACSKPSPMRATMREAGDAWDTLRKLVDKKGPSAGAGYGARIAQLLGGDAMTGSEIYKTSEAFRDLDNQTLEALAGLEQAMKAGSAPQTMGAIAEVKELCERCHTQKFEK
jgi:hypothetical protein